MSARYLIGDADLDLAVEPSSAAESGVKAIRSIGRSEDHHTRTIRLVQRQLYRENGGGRGGGRGRRTRVERSTIHTSEELSNNAALHGAAVSTPFRSNSVNLIHEDERRRLSNKEGG